jgi:hypothetical protein
MDGLRIGCSEHRSDVAFPTYPFAVLDSYQTKQPKLAQ